MNVLFALNLALVIENLNKNLQKSYNEGKTHLNKKVKFSRLAIITWPYIF